MAAEITQLRKDVYELQQQKGELEKKVDDVAGKVERILASFQDST